MATPPVQEHIPFWYPGNPVTAGRFGLNLMAGPGPSGGLPSCTPRAGTRTPTTTSASTRRAPARVGCTMLIAIAEDESEALEVATRGMNGLVRRTHAVHRWTSSCSARKAPTPRFGPLRKILGSIDAAIQFGAGTAEQIRDRFAEILAEGNTDYMVLQIPTGDMTFDEAKRTLDTFATKVKPDPRGGVTPGSDTCQTSTRPSRITARHSAGRRVLSCTSECPCTTTTPSPISETSSKTLR